MNKNELKKILYEYFEEHPYESFDQVSRLVEDAKKRAMRITIPKYQPLKVAIKEESQFFNEKLEKVSVEEKHDESTFSMSHEFKEKL